jgi:hypothetical protein
MGTKVRAQSIGHERRETRRERASERVPCPLAPFKIPPERDDPLIGVCQGLTLLRDGRESCAAVSAAATRALIPHSARIDLRRES